MWNKVHIVLFKHRLEFLSEQCQWKVDILINIIYIIKRWISLSCYYEVPSKRGRLNSTGNRRLRAAFQNPWTREPRRATGVSPHHQAVRDHPQAYLHAATGSCGRFPCSDIKHAAKHNTKGTKILPFLPPFVPLQSLLRAAVHGTLHVADLIHIPSV